MSTTANLGLKNDFVDGDTIPDAWLNTVADELDAASDNATADDVEGLEDDADDLRDLLSRLLARLTRSPLGPALMEDERLRAEIMAAFAKGY